MVSRTRGVAPSRWGCLRSRRRRGRTRVRAPAGGGGGGGGGGDRRRSGGGPPGLVAVSVGNGSESAGRTGSVLSADGRTSAGPTDEVGEFFVGRCIDRMTIHRWKVGGGGERFGKRTRKSDERFRCSLGSISVDCGTSSMPRQIPAPDGEGDDLASRTHGPRRSSGGRTPDVEATFVVTDDRLPPLEGLYHYIGEPWQWTDKHRWPDERWQARVTDRTMRQRPVSSAEHRRAMSSCSAGNGDVEIENFGLAPDVHGLGLGGWFLTRSVEFGLLSKEHAVCGCTPAPSTVTRWRTTRLRAFACSTPRSNGRSTRLPAGSDTAPVLLRGTTARG